MCELGGLVNGCTSNKKNPQSDHMNRLTSEKNNDDHDMLLNFRGSKVFDELEELYKPFYSFCVSSQTMVTTSISVPMDPMASEIQPTLRDSQATKNKTRKNQQKRRRIVKQVKADTVCSDTWAWRKYGQKPIKGSPYPRSYYRCSSSKGCSARKQVERCRLDPSLFIITYTAEHNHHHPTHSNIGGNKKKVYKFPTTTKAYESQRSITSHNRTYSLERITESEILQNEHVTIKWEDPMAKTFEDNEATLMPGDTM